LKNDLDGLQGINGDLNASKKDMEFNLSLKDQEAIKAAAELAKLRNQMMSKGDEDGQMKNQFKEL
jgi:hypothetical protein